jgi:hypothetical protein
MQVNYIDIGLRQIVIQYFVIVIGKHIVDQPEQNVVTFPALEWNVRSLRSMIGRNEAKGILEGGNLTGGAENAFSSSFLVVII